MNSNYIFAEVQYNIYIDMNAHIQKFTKRTKIFNYVLVVQIYIILLCSMLLNVSDVTYARIQKSINSFNI